jgi:hypothetical protein
MAPKDPTITIQIEGDPDENGDVRLIDLVEKVNALLAALRATEGLLADENRERVYYRVVELRKDSPATVTVMPVSQKRETRKAVVKAFDRAIRAANEQTVKGGVIRKMLPELRPFAALTPTSDRHIKKMTVKVHGVRSKKIVLFPQRPDWIPTVELDLSREPDYAYGSVAGRLERLDVHEGANKFVVWPKLGPRVSGTFSNAVKPLVLGAADKYVRVYGRLKYPHGESYPREIDHVSDIDVFEPADELPTLSELRGIAPDATGDMNIRDFIESLHDDD